jgi:asparagine synthase (glutamine-hydrolysing)
VREAQVPAPMSLEAATDALEEVLRDAVACRMIADVSLGAFLSGGVDSSAVVALMQAVSSTPVKTFSIGFHEAQYNEAAHAKAIAQHLGTDHTELYVTPDDCLEVIPQLPTLYDEPFADYSQIPTFLVARLARSAVTVALSGDGGDELFGGYKDYAKNLRDWRSQQAFWRHWPLAARRALAGMLTHAASQGRGLAGPAMGKRLRKLEKRGRRTLLFDSGAAMQAGKRARIKRADQLVLGARPVPCGLTEPERWADVADPLLGMMLVDFTTYMADDILTKVDRASMGVSLEVRCPLLDPRVVELAWSLPSSLRIGPNGGKHVLQNLLARHVPRELFERPKQGFNVPVEEWLRGPLRGWAEALLDEHRLHREGFLRPRPVRRLWEEHQSGQRSHTSLVWSLLSFQAWHEAWIKDGDAVKLGAAA